MWSTSDDSELEFTEVPKARGGGGSGGARSKQGKSKKSKSKKKNNNAISLGTVGTVAASEVKLGDIEDVQMDEGGGEEDVEVSDMYSTDEDVGMGCGKLALGIDPQDVEGYDGVSAPVNGSQYLLAVMKEKRSVPKVVVAKKEIKKVGAEGVTYLDRFKNSVNTSGFVSSMESNPYLPSQEIRNDKLYAFSVLRSKIEHWKDLIAKGALQVKPHNLRLPDSGNRVVWLRFCFGIKLEELAEFRKRNTDSSPETILDQYFIDLSNIDLNLYNEVNALNIESGDVDGSCLSQEVQGSGDGSSSATSKEGCKPLMSILLSLPQKQLELLVFYLATWIEQYGFLNKCLGEWLYALLACIEKPLEPSTMGDIRNICKSLITIRNNFCSKLMPVPDTTQNQDSDQMEMAGEKCHASNTSRAHEYINSLNLFIYLIGDYFSQKDLVMELS